MVAAIHNLRADIATEGKKAFMDGNESDIRELGCLVGKVAELEYRLDKIAPSFKTYALDIATETHPSEFPLADSTSESNIGSKNIDSVTCYYVKDKNNIKVRYISDSDIKLCGGSSVEWRSARPKEYEKRLKHLLSSNEIEIILQDDGNNDTLIIKRDIQFKSVNALMSFVLCKKVKNAAELLVISDDKTLLDYINSR